MVIGLSVAMALICDGCPRTILLRALYKPSNHYPHAFAVLLAAIACNLLSMWSGSKKRHMFLTAIDYTSQQTNEKNGRELKILKDGIPHSRYDI